jgi:hypothetical protein
MLGASRITGAGGGLRGCADEDVHERSMRGFAAKIPIS